MEPAATPIVAATPAATMNHDSMKNGGMAHGAMKNGDMNHNMDLGPADADYDLRFINAMIPHYVRCSGHG